MPDISMCTQNLCPNSHSCYRVQAKPSEYQSYSTFIYELSTVGVICDYYMPLYEIEENGRIYKKKG